MIIAITSTGKDLDSALDQRFGRAKHIILYNTEDSTSEHFDNTVNLNATQGAGIQTAQNIAEKGAQVLITGNLGPKAFRVLWASDIKAYSSNNSTVSEAIQSYKENKLSELATPNVEGHWN